MTVEPHLVVLVHCPPDEDGPAAPWRSSTRRDGEQIARNVQPLQVEPGKFNYRLVRAELDFADYGTVEAHCRVDDGPRDGRALHARARAGPADRRLTDALRRRPVAAPEAAEATGEVVGRRCSRRWATTPDLAVLFVTRPTTSARSADIAARGAAAAAAGRARRAPPRWRSSAAPARSRTSPRSPCGRPGWPRRPRPVRLDRHPHADGVALVGPVGARRSSRATLLLLLADPFSLPGRRHRRGARAGRPAGCPWSAAWRRPPRRRAATGSCSTARSTDDGAVGVVLPAGGRHRPSSCPRAAGRSASPMIVTRAERQHADRARRPARARPAAGAGRGRRPGRAGRRSPRGLHLGVVSTSTSMTFGPGDFLVRNVLGRRPRAAGARGRRPGRGRHHRAVPGPRRRRRPTRTCARCWPAARGDGALVFTCNGRGRRPLRRARPRRRSWSQAAVGGAGRRGHVLRRRARPGRRPQLPARLHRQASCFFRRE